MPPRDIDAGTRERLLDEAEALFAEKGFDAVSVREIIAAAKCNLGAVNYYFGSKKNLYLEVFRSRWMARVRVEHEYFWSLLEEQEPLSLRVVIQSLAQTLLEGPFSDAENRRHHQLISREIGHPTEVTDTVHEQVMKPFFSRLAAVMLPLLPEPRPLEQVMLDIMSIYGLLLHFQIAREGISRMVGRPYDKVLKAQLAAQVTRFALSGLGRGVSPDQEKTQEATAQQ